VTTPKVPTTISYEKGNIKWGYDTCNSGEVLRGVKLLLDESQKTRYPPSLKSKELLDKKGKFPAEVVAAFLKKLVKQGRHILCRRFGDAAESMDIDYVLTVPAVWSDKAKNATLSAGLAAGMLASNVFLISGPEAAALYCFNTMLPKTIQVGLDLGLRTISIG
jgi:molecular chaperone DnaK (HSP70)